MAGQRTTLIVDPDLRGHHLQSVAAVADLAAESGPVVFLTSRGASKDPAFAEYLGEAVADGTVQVEEVFDEMLPPTALMADVGAARCRELAATSAPVGTFVHMDADQALKRWWLVAPKAFRGLAPRPRFVFMLTRYPARLRPTDVVGMRLRVKALLAVAARAVRRLDRVSGFSGREETRKGWIVKRARDPNVCSAHADDRADLRVRHGLPADRRLAGVFGAIDPRKNAPLILEALKRTGHDASLVLSGALDPETRGWLEGLGPDDRALVIASDGYLSNADLDEHIAAVDVIPLALTNNGPSGIMGKAQAAGTPVVTAGSLVRAREVEVMGGGVACDIDVDSLATAMRRVFDGEVEGIRGTDHLVTPRAYAEIILGVSSSRVPSRRSGR